MNTKLHHIGYIVENIETTITALHMLDNKLMASSTTMDDVQRCRICFVQRDNEPMIELLEPYENNKSLLKMLTQRGNAPYHICYEVEDVDALFDELSETDGWTPLFRPVEASAFENRLITYFYNAKIGYVEFLNEK